MQLDVKEIYKVMLEDLEVQIIKAEQHLQRLIGKQAGVKALYDALVKQALADSKPAGQAPASGTKSKADQPES